MRLRPLQVNRVPQHYCSSHQVEAAGTVALLFEATVSDFAQPVKEDSLGQRIARFALVQSCNHASYVVIWPGQFPPSKFPNLCHSR